MENRRRFLRCSALAVLCLTAGLLCGCGAETEREPGSEQGLPVIVIGSDNYPPFNYTGADGQPTGVDAELAMEAFRRMGYRAEFVTIDWEEKKMLLEEGVIDCAWGSFSMNGREDEYRWAGPYLHSRQVVAVRVGSGIYTLQDLQGKTLAVQSTTKPEELFRNAAQNGLPKLRAIYSLRDRDLIYPTLSKGYADALAAHESAVCQFMKDYKVEYRILDEPLMTAELGVAFAKGRTDGLPEQLTETFREMLADGTVREIASRYLDDPEHYLEGLEGGANG